MAKIHADRMVAELAVAMANEAWESAMSTDNELYTAIRRKHAERDLEYCRKRFVRVLAPKLVAPARATLAKMLGTTCDPVLKNKIYDALLRDAAFTLGRNRADRRRVSAH